VPGFVQALFLIMNKAILVLPVVIAALLLAIWSGWIRIGFSLPVTGFAAQHGSMMVNCFLASLIYLERAVTFKNKTILLLPFISAVAVISIAAGYVTAAMYMHVLSGAGFVAMCAYFIYKYKELHYFVFFVGAFCLLLGNMVLLKTTLYASSVVWWMLFLLFTIVAERLELSRFLPSGKTRQRSLVVILAFVFISAFIPFHSGGNWMLSISIALTALWLLKFDMAFKSIRNKGQHRYSGLLLITGYAWLFITALTILVQPHFAFGYDAFLHSFFLGFVFAMIFSHAPIILPAIAKLPIKIYRPVLYVWFVLLQLSLIVRIIADLFGDITCRKYAGLTNGITIIIFFINVAVIVRGELLQRKLRSAKS
jgi:hypothetical protein